MHQFFILKNGCPSSLFICVLECQKLNSVMHIYVQKTPVHLNMYIYYTRINAHIFACASRQILSFITKSKTNFLQWLLDAQSNKHGSLSTLAWIQVFQVTRVWLGFPRHTEGVYKGRALSSDPTKQQFKYKQTDRRNSVWSKINQSHIREVQIQVGKESKHHHLRPTLPSISLENAVPWRKAGPPSWAVTCAVTPGRVVKELSLVYSRAVGG